MGSLLRKSKGRCHQLLIDRSESLVIVVGVGALVDIFRLYSREETERRVLKKMKKAKKAIIDAAQLADLDRLVRADLSIEVRRLGDYKAEAKVRCASFAPRHPPSAGDMHKRNVFLLLHDNRLVCASVAYGIEDNRCESVVLPTRLGQLGHRAVLRAVRLANDQYTFATGAADCVKVWNRDTLQCVLTIDTDKADVSALLYVTGDRHLIVATKTGALRVYDLADGQLVQQVDDAHEKHITALTMQPDGVGRVIIQLITFSADSPVPRTTRPCVCGTLSYARPRPPTTRCRTATHRSNWPWLCRARCS